MSQTTFRPSEAEKYLKLGKNSIYPLLKKGTIPSEQVDGRYVIRLADLDAFKAGRNGEATKEKQGKKGKRKTTANRVSKREELPDTPHRLAGTDELINAFRTLSDNGYTHVGRGDRVSLTADILAAYETLREHGLAT